jgi:hypothetical protein
MEWRERMNDTIMNSVKSDRETDEWSRINFFNEEFSRPIMKIHITSLNDQQTSLHQSTHFSLSDPLFSFPIPVQSVEQQD